MSVEAPNHIKYASPSTPSPLPKEGEGLTFWGLLNRAKHQLTPTTTPPSSPKTNTRWLAYQGATNQNNDAAKQQMRALHSHGLLKFTHIQSNQADGLTDVLQTLKQTPKIKHLVLRHSSLQNHHLRTMSEVLKQNNGLAWLVLDHNAIDDRGIRHLSDGLKKTSSIRHVVLSHNHIAESGAKALSHALRVNSSIETLWLDHNAIGYNGAKQLVLAAATHPNLTTIGLKNTGLSSQEKHALINNCPPHLRLCV
jgi:hypothetical protein